MKYSKLLLVVSFVVLFGMTAAYAGDKCCKKAEKKCSTAVKVCKDANDANTVKKCAATCQKDGKKCAKQCTANRQNAEKCKQNAAGQGRKKGWFSSFFSKNQTQTGQSGCVKNDAGKCAKKQSQTCSVKNKENCKKECVKKCDKKSAEKCCKKAKACPKPTDPNAPKTK